MEPSTSVDQGSSSKSHCGEERTGLPIWNLKHKIFLSHSGAQKEFVRQLCKDLEVETHQPFFDERSSSLMMGERFAPLIFEAARQCVVAVIVLSKEFLTSKWPMLELVEFVKAKKSHNPHLKLFPLFYKLSLEDLKVESIANRWEATWIEIIPSTSDQVMPQNDTHRHLNLSLCMEALQELRGSNGLKFENFSSEVAYREAIVKEISLLVLPDLLDDTSNVIGNERLCKVMGGMFVEDPLKDSNTFKLGLYGMGGLGKTTMSRALCMFFHERFNGRVFHVELGSRPLLDLQKLVLTKLLRINMDVVERIHSEHEGQKLLKDYMNRQPVFLVVDNISNDHESKSQALAFLEVGFHPGSMIMITSRSFDVVEDLFPSHSNAIYCKAIPKLNEEEAKLIFLRRGACQRKLETLTIEEQEILDECIFQCHFLVDNEERQFHPLALHALADYYHDQDKVNMLTWKDHLGDLDKLRHSNESSNIFGVLGLQFRTLTFKKKLIFLDLCLYIKQNVLSKYSTKQLKLLVDIHDDTLASMNIQLRSLKRSGIINITFNIHGDQFISIHDLYREFAKWYVIDGEGSRCAELGCFYHTISTNSLPYVLKRTSPSSSQLQRVRLENLKCVTFPSKKVQEWCNVVVLQLCACSNLKVLDLHGLRCLCHLELVNLHALESFHFAELQARNNGSNDTLESLQHVVLTSLTSLKQIPNFSLCTLLKTFQMLKCEQFLLEPPSFVGCSQLEALKLDWNRKWKMEILKLDTLTSLTSLKVFNQDVVSPVHWSEVPGDFYFDSQEIPGLGNCLQLQKLRLQSLLIYSLVGLEELTELQVLHLRNVDLMWLVLDVSTLANLQQLDIIECSVAKVDGLENLQQLRRLSFEECSNLISLPNLDHLPKLECVVFFNCNSLHVLPQLPPGCKLKHF